MKIVAALGGGPVAQLAVHPPSVEGYSPDLVGRSREVMLSKKSGTKSIEYKLEQLKLKASSEQVDKILSRVKDLGMKKKGLVSDQELIDIVRAVGAA